MWPRCSNVPSDEAIKTLADRAFRNNWFNFKYDLNICKHDLIDLLGVATCKDQLFQSNHELLVGTDTCRSSDGVPLEPLLTNAFISSFEEKLDVEGKQPPFYR